MIRIKKLTLSDNNTKQCGTSFYGDRTYLCKTHYDAPDNKNIMSCCADITERSVADNSHNSICAIMQSTTTSCPLNEHSNIVGDKLEHCNTRDDDG